MEGVPLVCYSTGTMNSLLDKLTKLKNHSNPADDFFGLTAKLKEDLLGLKEFYDKLGVSTVWMKQLRELVFKIEDWIDLKPEANMLVPSDKEEIQYFMHKIKDARERFTWYGNLFKIEPTEPDLSVVAPSNNNINPQLLVEEKTCHDVLHGPIKELVKHLTDKEEEMRKVVSVVGMEGIGKTTLAKEIYSEFQLNRHRHFECQAFVSIGRRMLMKDILKDILRQVKPWSHKWGHWIVTDVQGIITEIREYLVTKRYFIVVDGIWSTWAWEVISCALPNNLASRVLTTSCIMDIGKSCSSYPNDLVYQMEALSKENSRILFHSRIITLQDGGADFKEVSDDMVNMCGGMPLAIIVAAGLLARRSEEMTEQNMFGKQYYTYEGMTKILYISYASLSLPLRSCFLYLSVFPENYTIKKNSLIRLWEVEGFISRTDEECLWVTGERYFNELISRRLIQPVFDYSDDDQAVGCTIHNVIIDFIRSLSREENFATRATEMNSGPFPCDTIRRFSLDCGNEDEVGPLSTSTTHLSSMRSLTVFGDVKGKLDPPRPPSASEDDGMKVDTPRPPLVSNDDKEMFDPPASSFYEDDQGTFDPRCLPSVSEHGEEMFDPQAQSVSRVVEGVFDPQCPPSVSEHGEEMLDDLFPSVSRDVERKFYPQGLPLVFKHGEELHSTPVPRVSMSILSAFKLMRVLDLEDTKNLTNDHLKGIGGLVLLRYLGLGGTGVTQLPEDIGGLEQLETLDLRRNLSIHTFPESMDKLQKLRHLLLDVNVKRSWKMQELEEANIRATSSGSLDTVVELLRNSERLRRLGVTLSTEHATTDLDSFLKEVIKSKLHSLSLNDCTQGVPLLVSLGARMSSLLGRKFEARRFELKISAGGTLLEEVPHDMRYFANLTHLHIEVITVDAKGFHVLGGLTKLVLLNLSACSGPRKKYIIEKGMFSCLKVFSFKMQHTSIGLEFEKGAMPQLQILQLSFRVSLIGNHYEYLGIGIKHLTCLTRVRATILCAASTALAVETAELDIRTQLFEMATKPTLELRRENEESPNKDKGKQSS